MCNCGKSRATAQTSANSNRTQYEQQYSDYVRHNNYNTQNNTYNSKNVHRADMFKESYHSNLYGRSK